MKILRFAWLIACLPLCGQIPSAPEASTPSVADDYRVIAGNLDAGGDLYGIINIRGDIQRATGFLQELLDLARKINPQAMAQVPPIDLQVLENHFALHQLQGVGVSSLPLPDDRFRMKWFYRFDEPPSGIWNLYPPTAEPVGILPMTPPEVSQVAEGNFHLDALRVVIRGVFQEVMGEGGAQLVDLQLAKQVPETDVTFAQIIQALSTRISFHATYKPLPTETPVEQAPPLEFADFLGKLRGAGSLLIRLRPFLEKQKDISVVESVSSLVYGLTVNGREAVVAIVDKSSGDLFLASSVAYWERCQSLSVTLADSPEFQKLQMGLPAEVMVFNYISPGYGRYIETTLDQLLMNMPADELATEDRATIQQMVKRMVGHFLKPACSATVAQEGGWLTISHLGISGKDYALAVGAAIPAGLVAAMAIPAYGKARETSQEKTIENNLRLFLSAGQQYMLDEGVAQATYTDLVGPGKYLEELNPVAGEDYTELVVLPDTTSLFVVTEDGRVVEYSLPEE